VTSRLRRDVSGIALFTAGIAAALSVLSARAGARAAPAEPWIFDIALPPERTCGPCHADIVKEWAPTLHARSWTNDNILDETEGFKRIECRPCHSPEPVLALAAGLEPSSHEYTPPVFREINTASGVHCLSCHGLPGDAGVAAERSLPWAPCRPRRDDRLLEVALCASCHDPTHQAAQEYWTSRPAQEGVRCHDCHMAFEERKNGRDGWSHVFPGGFSKGQVRRGLRAEAWCDGRAVVVALSNRAGHKFPGEVPSRSLTIAFEAFDAAGKRVLDESVLLRRSFKTKEEHDRPDNRLLPGETRELRQVLPDSAVRAVVTVVFRSLPLQAERDAIRIGRFELVP
jgi:hypothetical protein